MSNSCSIGSNSSKIEIYLHWNGGLDSVAIFLNYLKLQGFPSIEQGGTGVARLCQLIGNFMGGNSTLYLEKPNTPISSNHGKRIVKNWMVENTLHSPYYDADYLMAGAKDMDALQPTYMQIMNAIADSGDNQPKQYDETVTDQLFKVVDPSKNIAICFDAGDTDIHILLAILKYCEMRQISNVGAFFCQIVGNYIGKDKAFFVKSVAPDEDLGLNTYFIEGHNLAANSIELAQTNATAESEFKIKQLLKVIDASQPPRLQLGAFLDSIYVDRSTIEIGDVVFQVDIDGFYKPHTVVGFVGGLNKTTLKGTPYTDRHPASGKDNPNNHLSSKMVYKAV